MNIKYKRNALTVQDYQALRKACGLLPVNPDALERALTHSCITVSAYFDHTICGMARVVGDLGLFYYIQDVLVLEGRRGCGIGTQLITHALDQIAAETPTGHTVQVSLISAPEQVDFYRKFGFQPCPTIHAGPGMLLALDGKLPPRRKTYFLKTKYYRSQFEQK